jgi:hypothetical protein
MVRRSVPLSIEAAGVPERFLSLALSAAPPRRPYRVAEAIVISIEDAELVAYV